MSDLQLQQLQTQADSLGVKYHHRAGAAKIQAAIEAYLAAGNDGAAPPQVAGGPPPYEPPMNEAEYRAQRLGERRRFAGSLVRCRITCMNPNKTNYPGEIISVGSSKLGTFKKYIPFDGKPYHVPRIIFDHLKDRECSVFVDQKDDRGHKTRRGKLIKEFAIEILDPLSVDELEDLRKAQALAKGSA